MTKNRIQCDWKKTKTYAKMSYQEFLLAHAAWRVSLACNKTEPDRSLYAEKSAKHAEDGFFLVRSSVFYFYICLVNIICWLVLAILEDQTDKLADCLCSIRVAVVKPIYCLLLPENDQKVQEASKR